MDNHQLVWVILKYQFLETRPTIDDEDDEDNQDHKHKHKQDTDE